MTNSFTNLTENISADDFINKSEISAENWTLWHIGGGIGLLGGLLILFGASFLCIFDYLAGENRRGVWLFLTVFPLWMLGAHCFDKIEDLKRARRIERGGKAD